MPRTLRHFHAWRRLGLLLVAADVYLSLSPSAGGVSVIPDKLGHFIMYATIGFWFATLYPRALTWVFAGCVALGGSLEFLQGLGESRHAEWLDIAANTAGAVAGCAVAYLLPVNLFNWFENLMPARAR